MLDQVGRDDEDGQAPIETRVGSAMDLAVLSDSADVALCQQGLQFFGDPGSALGEMRRVLRPGGTAAAAVWLAGKRLDPFSTYSEICDASEVPPRFPDANFTMTLDEVGVLLAQSGFTDIELVVADLTPHWRDAEAAAQGVRGTPLGPALAALADDAQQALFSALCAAFEKGEGPDRTMYAVLARGTAEG